MSSIGVNHRYLVRNMQVPDAAAAWTPASLPNLVAWFDASNLASITSSSGKVSQWNDLSGNGNHVTQATATSQPTTGTRTINSLNVLDCFSSPNSSRLDPVSNFMSAATSATVFHVMQLDADPPTAVNGEAGSPLERWGNSGNESHEPFSDGVVYHDFGSTVRKTCGNPVPAFTTARQITINTASGAWSYVIDGTTFFSTGTNTVGWGASASLCGGGGGSFGLDGRLAEVVFCSSVIGGTDLTSARSYFQTKWGTA